MYITEESDELRKDSTSTPSPDSAPPSISPSHTLPYWNIVTANKSKMFSFNMYLHFAALVFDVVILGYLTKQ